MGWIILLIIIGLILYFAELVLLPGITIAAIGSFACLTGAITLAFMNLSLTTGFIILSIVVVLLIIMTILFLRPKTWNKAALHTEIRNSIAQPISTLVPLGTQAVTLTRLAPMGKVIINGETFEAKSLDSFIDQQTPVIVTNYDNQTIIVQPIKTK